MNDLIKILILLTSIKHFVYFLSLWQRKEYRLDRFLSEFGNFNSLIGEYLKSFYIFALPKFTARTIFITHIFAIIQIAFLIYSLYIWLLFFLPFPVTSLLVLISWPIFQILHKQRVTHATQKTAEFTGIKIGITGSYGKSTTKELLVWVLSQNHQVLATPKNINSLAGVANLINNQLHNQEYFI